MSPTLTCLTLALIGVDLGYRPGPNGGTEFIIQVDPPTLQASRPGDPLELNVPPQLRDARPTRFSLWLGNESVPHILPTTAQMPPATAPIGPASPVMAAVASSQGSSTQMPADGGPVRVAPPAGSLPVEQATSGPALTPSTAAPESRIGDLPPLGADSGNSPQPNRPWIVMCLAVIALLASNFYVGWLFWDARQRYLNLLAQSFSFAQQPAEA